jgi:hypothetical protein
LKKDLGKFFHADTIDQIFVHTEEILQEKIQGNKMQIYKDSKNPIFVDPTGKGDYFPTSNLFNLPKNSNFNSQKNPLTINP